MIEVLAAHKQELTKELQERVQAFFAAYNEAPENVSIKMKLTEPDQANGVSTIHILVKDACTGVTLSKSKNLL
jgi:hypothetical protein